MRKHTKEFKSSISTFGRELDSKITVLGTELILEKEDLFSITPITNSTLLKTVMKEVDFESKKQIGIGQEVNIKSGVKVNGKYEYIDYGNYSVYKSEYKAETDTYSHICYDKMLKTMIDYTPLDITYPINLREYINAIATKCGLEFADKNSTFANYNTSINEDHFSNGNYTFRDVLDYIAQLVGGWLCINDNDELEIRYPELAKNYGEASGESLNFISDVSDEISKLTIDGKSYQATSTDPVSPSPDYPSEIESVGTYFSFDEETGKYGIEVKNTGKNLFNINTATLNSCLKWADGTYSTENLSVASDFIKIEKGKSYISKYKMQIILFNENKEYIGYYNNTTGQYNSFTISTDSECNYVKVSFRSSSNNNVDFTTIGDIQLEKGTQATTYEPYQENILNIDLQGNELCSLPNNVKDELVIENGRAKIIKNVGKVVLDGSEDSWVENSATKGLFQVNVTNVDTNIDTLNTMSNYLIGVTGRNIVQATYYTNDSVVTYTSNRIFFRLDEYANNLEGFKAWLSTHNTIVYYQLATATEIDLGEVTPLSTFEGVNNVSLDANIQTNMSLTYTTEFEELDKHFLKDVNVSFSKKYGAVNSVVFSRGNGSDNIYRKDNASINKNGLTEIKIADNPFLEGDDRENFIQSLFDKINGLEFYIMDVASTGIMYLELGDFYYFNMVEEKPSLKSGLVKSGMRKAQGSSGGKFLCLLMNDEIKITQGLEESIYTDEPEITETDYKTASITDTSIKNAIIQTNKNSAEILLKVNSDEVVSAINLSPEKIKISSAKLDIDAIATFTNSKLAEAGSTVINGANITTGSINCDRLNGGTINGQKISGSTISGGSISIQKGVYYFNMGTSTSNPNCSGLNVGTYGIKAHSDITATGFAITDSDTGKSQPVNIYDGHGHVHYLTFTGGILTKWEYK